VLPGVVTLAEHWTGGEYGLTGIAPLSIFGYSFGPVALYELTVGAFALVWVCAANLTQSAWGYRFKLLRDAPRAGEAVGINLNKVRLVVYAWSSIPPALAGVMMAYTNRFVGYQSFGIGLTLFLLTGVVLGGGGSVWGPIIGMAPLVVLSLFVGPFSEYNAIGLAVGLLISSIVFTNGIVPEIVKRYQRRFPADAAAPPTAEMAEKRAAMFRNQTGSTRPVHPGPALEVTDVRKRFDGLQALDGVRFTLSKGTLCGLVGPNGCGKSTFLNTICGFVTPDTGSIAVNGRATTALPPHALLGMGVGRSFQVPQLVGDMTVLENIESGLIGDERGRLWSSLLRTPAIRQQEARRREMAFAAFDEVGLPRSILHMKAEELSLGMKRLVEIGRAIAAHPSLLLLDEPAAGLNNTERSELGLLLRRLKTDGMTILVIEHNVPFVLDFCDEILLMQAGTIVTHASRSDKLPAQL
ncbi:MAG: ATP-binding cassette domain-containing protein, partial [Desulfobacterales bacterium]|nr:ATP-binding cassette domain-containing protein [Desulfobacterales bacterium]